MSFKFKLGDSIVPILAREMGIRVGPSEVTALQLGDRIEIQPIGTYSRHTVEAKDYEKYDEEVVEFDIEDNPLSPRQRIKKL